MTGYKPVPWGFNSPSQMVCALQANCKDEGQLDYRKHNIELSHHNRIVIFGNCDNTDVVQGKGILKSTSIQKSE